MAQAVVTTAFGGPENLHLDDLVLPVPGPGPVAVSVRAAGVNPADVKLRSGAFGADQSWLPMRLGSEASGTVTAVGDDVTSVGVGDEVIAFRAAGAYATDLVVDASALTPKPASLSWEEAAGLMLTGATAVHTLVATSVGDGDTVLIHGSAGGVGQMAVQLARLRGARVIGTASPRNHDLLRDLGAEAVEYGDGLADRVRALAPEGVDAALDLVGTEEAMDVSLALVADHARIATIANFAAAAPVQRLGGGPDADPGTEIRDAARPELARLAGEGRLKVRVDRTFALAEVADAHRYLTDGHPSGKVVLVV
jgi:NADPH:quinone reductase-like Zn-dependent oxidoreductase